MVTAPHTGLIERRGVQSVIDNLLLGRSPEPGGDTLATFVSAVASPWRVPSLSSELFPAGECDPG